ncbi:hypothetical protein [Streptomyces sp. NPDC003247]|uniref:hypothetical protein n=1 Tax=Streptomyces sp. NPDC003247 TaxID=3364677 RepID=UPI0036C0FC44
MTLAPGTTPATASAGRTAAAVTEAYLSDPRLADAVRDTVYPPAFQECWGARMLSRPLFTDGPELHRAAADVQDLFALLASLPRRLFDGDTARYCDALGIAPDRAAVINRFADAPGLAPRSGQAPRYGQATRYGRADLYHDGSAFKLLEFNIASDLGGTDRSQMQRALLTHPAFADFAAEHGLDHVHTGERIAVALREAALPLTRGVREPRVGLVCAPGGLAAFGHLLLAFAEMMRDLGLPLTLGELDTLTERGDRLHLDGAPLDVVLRFFTVDDLCADPSSAARAELAFRAHEEGRAVLWTPMDSSLYSNKGALALLSDPATAFTPAERALTDRLLPWTRLLADGPPTPGPTPGETVTDLLSFCREHRTQLLLKPLRDFGGTGVIPGWERDPDDWARLLQDRMADATGPLTGLGNRWIVQRRVLPRTEPVLDPDTGARTPWVAAWGLFLTPQGYAGTDVRAAPASASAVVNYGSNPLTRTTGVFTVGSAR